MTGSVADFTARASGALIVLTVGSAPASDSSPGGPSGCLVGFWSQCSIHPEAFAVWVSKANHTATVAEVGAPVVMHLVPRGKADLARWFGETSGDDTDTFAGTRWEAGPDDVPVLTSLRDRVLGRIGQVVDLGDRADHVCVVVEPLLVELEDDPDDPVLLRLDEAADFSAAHPA